MKKFAKNIPNILSGYRLLAFPVLLWLIFSGDRPHFVILISISLGTDFLDGLIARAFKLQTEFGAKLDSYADLGTFIAVLTAFTVFERAFVASKQWAFLGILILWIAPMAVSLWRFHRIPNLHLYSSKAAGYFFGFFIFTYFIWGNADWYFYLMGGVLAVSFLEELIILSKIPALRSNAKGIYWMLKEKGRIE